MESGKSSYSLSAVSVIVWALAMGFVFTGLTIIYLSNTETGRQIVGYYSPAPMASEFAGIGYTSIALCIGGIIGAVIGVLHSLKLKALISVLILVAALILIKIS